jgi:hypothetical protein
VSPRRNNYDVTVEELISFVHGASDIVVLTPHLHEVLDFVGSKRSDNTHRVPTSLASLQPLIGGNRLGDLWTRVGYQPTDIDRVADLSPMSFPVVLMRKLVNRIGALNIVESLLNACDATDRTNVYRLVVDSHDETDEHSEPVGTNPGISATDLTPILRSAALADLVHYAQACVDELHRRQTIGQVRDLTE